MKFTLAWLKDHLETSAPLEDISARLTMLGLEVESIEDKTAALKPFTVAEIVKAEQHPNADRLRVCTVATGKDTLQIVLRRAQRAGRASRSRCPGRAMSFRRAASR